MSLNDALNAGRNDYHEEISSIDVREFQKVIESRRSIRRYSTEHVPEQVMRDCLRMACLAPSSSNLMPWQFYWVRNPEVKAKLVEICLSQPAAATASELIVCVARTDTWKKNSKLVLEELRKTGNASPAVLKYYQRLIPMTLMRGFLGSWVPIKWLIYNGVGLFQPMVRNPVGKVGRKIWAIKSTALACENLMLSLRAHGYDSCPMEGFDESRAKKLLHLSGGAEVVMVISAGKRIKGGVYGPKVHLPLDHFIFEI